MISIGEVLQALEPSQGRAAPTGSGVKTLPEQLQASAKAFAEIALVLIGLSYLAGFLVTYTFQSRLGIHDANAEFLRIRYIHTGLLCLAFPMFIAVPLTAHLWMLKKQRQHPDLYKLARRKNFIVGKSHLPYTVQLLCVSLCLFVYVLFEPYGEFHAHLWFVTGLLVLLLGQLVIGRKYVGFAAKKEHPVLRGLLAAGSCLVLFFALKGTILYLCLIFSKAASYWLFIASLDFYLFNTLDSKLVFWYPGQKQGVYLARWALVMTLSILSVLTFAYRVYPYIPADKGGGNFHFSRNTEICMLADGILPQDVQNLTNKSCSMPLKVIEITDSTIYAARTDDSGTNEQGEVPPKVKGQDSAQTWSDGYFPTVYAISRSKVAFMQLESPKAAQ